MPGAPNRPPETAPSVPPEDPTARRVLRRLAPARVALRLDLWKGAPSPELVLLLERAESNYQGGNLVEASSSLDQLAVKFAEPRWPTLPMPFRRLRVEIPQPQPPQWDPEHALPVEEKETRRARRDAELHRDLARATLAWATSHATDLTDLAPGTDRAAATLEREGPTDAFWADIDPFWVAVRTRIAMPKAGARPTPPAASAAAELA